LYASPVMALPGRLYFLLFMFSRTKLPSSVAGWCSSITTFLFLQT
jgi:hypothetical protein